MRSSLLRKSESSLWKYIRGGMAGVASHLVRIESSTGGGIPDVNYCINGVEGWIELKVLDPVPVKPTTAVPLAHFSAQQRVWFRTRAAQGGKVFLLLRVGRSAYWLFDSKIAEHRCCETGEWLLGDWETRAIARWKRKIDFEELASFLKGKRC